MAQDPVIALLGIYPKEVKGGSQKDICTLMFTAAQLTAKCPRTDKWINKVKCDIYLQWNIIQSLKRMNSCHMLQ